MWQWQVNVDLSFSLNKIWTKMLPCWLTNPTNPLSGAHFYKASSICSDHPSLGSKKVPNPSWPDNLLFWRSHFLSFHVASLPAFPPCVITSPWCVSPVPPCGFKLTSSFFTLRQIDLWFQPSSPVFPVWLFLPVFLDSASGLPIWILFASFSDLLWLNKTKFLTCIWVMHVFVSWLPGTSVTGMTAVSQYAYLFTLK